MPAHTAVQMQLEIELLGFERLQHPSYSPDLARMDFAVFPKLKSKLCGVKVNDFGELKRAPEMLLDRLILIGANPFMSSA